MTWDVKLLLNRVHRADAIQAKYLETFYHHHHHHHHHHLFAQYSEMNSKICNVPDRIANSFWL